MTITSSQLQNQLCCKRICQAATQNEQLIVLHNWHLKPTAAFTRCLCMFCTRSTYIQLPINCLSKPEVDSPCTSSTTAHVQKCYALLTDILRQ